MAKRENPYQALPDRAFWKLAVANRSLFDFDDLWSPKFHIGRDESVVTFGSCFAQHIGRALKARGFAWTSHEPAPKELSPANAARFNYDIFSARTANIYTTSLLLQWVRWALGERVCPKIAWAQDGRWFDPFRPAIEPGGFDSAEEVIRSRAVTIAALRRCIEHSRYFVFTLGLTESWRNRDDGYEYPVCPGTIAGEYDADRDVFENQRYPQILEALTAAFDLIKAANPAIRFITTVSPVPLTATASGDHVMVATMRSKSVLRAVAGDLAAMRDDVDYFPSYELCSSPATRGAFFEPNLREVNHHGVGLVMARFFSSLEAKYGAYPAADATAVAVASKTTSAQAAADIVCEEELLAAFGDGR